MSMSARLGSEHLTVPRARMMVFCVAAIGTVIRFILLYTTKGSADVSIFLGFSEEIEDSGPIRIYEQPLPWLPVYNHPPLAGWILLGMSELNGMGFSFAALIRLPATLADAVSSMLVFEILRRRTSVHSAMGCAWTVALSPLLIAISGYHGNNDPVAVMLAIAAAYLLVDKKRPWTAGLVAALSVSVKFVPVVTLPILLVVAARSGRQALLSFCAGLFGLTAFIWGPVVLTVPAALKENVVDYQGQPWPIWGLMRFADLLGISESSIAFAQGEGHLFFVLLCVAIGIWLVWRRPDEAPVVVGLTLALLLLLSTAGAVQYLAWAAVGMSATGLWQGLAYNAIVGAVAYMVYTGPSPMFWNEDTLSLAVFGWTVLALGIASGFRKVLARPQTATPLHPPPHPLHPSRARLTLCGRPEPDVRVGHASGTPRVLPGSRL
ncbi:glycosyltransferase family 39 protein [Streptomyces himalayensis]|uniref:Glycosyltransferase family 39 protein n=1 Tax=Streptomyces himalayensis subsp. himalayensis TaxID=2756131 RepID=A0A7W0DRP6_9ACTN|nr:glycosyltransferase family 39 protein [Streptomyces himalayensis]MBA2949528.1 glycosyltransferase family 39 protein [Streptomyces himalayensis subsp. himalayensis]